jgi:hypothetical protein
MFPRAADVDAFTQNLNARAAAASQRKQQLLADIDRMRIDLQAARKALQQLPPLPQHASDVRRDRFAQ